MSFTDKIKVQQEIKSENENISNIISELITIKTKKALNSLFSIINTRIKYLHQEIFSKLQYQYNIPDYSTSKLNLKKLLILTKIKTKCNYLFQIYKLNILKKKQKYFKYWKNISSTNKMNEILEKNISEKINKSYEPKINNLNKEFKNKQKTLDELKESEKVLQNSNKQIEKEKDSLIKNKKKLAQKIEQIEKENILLEKEKKNKININTNTYQNFHTSKKDEEKIKELEKRLKELEEAEIDRKNYMTEYSEEMGKIMGVFEQKAQEIMRLQNIQIRRRHDTNSTNAGYSTHFDSELSNTDNFFVSLNK